MPPPAMFHHRGNDESLAQRVVANTAAKAEGQIVDGPAASVVLEQTDERDVLRFIRLLPWRYDQEGEEYSRQEEDGDDRRHHSPASTRPHNSRIELARKLSDDTHLFECRLRTHRQRYHLFADSDSIRKIHLRQHERLVLPDRFWPMD